MKIALVHDDLVQWGGAERMLVALTELFPEAPIYTSIFDQYHPILKQQFKAKRIITSFIQKIPGWRGMYKALLPLYPIAFEQFDFSDYDVVISQTTRFAKSVITKPQTKHICYCHTPPRFLWNFSGEKESGILGRLGYLSFLRNYDKVASHRVDYWVAGSKNAQARIKDVYGSDSTVIYPFVETEKLLADQSFDGGYFLVVSRLVRYKRVDIAVKLATEKKLPLKVVGDGPERSNLQRIAGPTVEFLGLVEEELLVKLFQGCRALIVTAEEDFGLTSLEAQAVGKPVIAFGKGGALETVIEGETGYFYPSSTPESLFEALQKLDKNGYNLKRCLQQVQKFSKKKFMREFQNLVSSL